MRGSSWRGISHSPEEQMSDSLQGNPERWSMKAGTMQRFSLAVVSGDLSSLMSTLTAVYVRLLVTSTQADSSGDRGAPGVAFAKALPSSTQYSPLSVNATRICQTEADESLRGTGIAPHKASIDESITHDGHAPRARCED